MGSLDNLSASEAKVESEKNDHDVTVSASLDSESKVQESRLGCSEDSVAGAKVANPVVQPETEVTKNPMKSVTKLKFRNEKLVEKSNSSGSSKDSWSDLVKGTTKKLQKKRESFTLPSGEACVKIPNSVIERNKKSWDCFVLGQFYSDPPSIGTLHSIANGIWSRQYRDLTVSEMEGNAFLLRIPNAFTRNRVINQRLWQFEKQTMFVAKWEPGVITAKPELTSALIWLELRKVPLQFFHEEGLERIPSLVGDPKFLHTQTANKTNLEVAKVFMIIDPRKPLPEAVDVQFENGDIRRIEVSSPFMPPVCEHCKEIGHSIKRCTKAPITCERCNSTTHSSSSCPKAKLLVNKRKKRNSVYVPKKILVKDSAAEDKLTEIYGNTEKSIIEVSGLSAKNPEASRIELTSLSKVAAPSVGEARNSVFLKKDVTTRDKAKGKVSDIESDVKADSFDVSFYSSTEEGDWQELGEKFREVWSKKGTNLPEAKAPLNFKYLEQTRCFQNVLVL